MEMSIQFGLNCTPTVSCFFFSTNEDPRWRYFRIKKHRLRGMAGTERSFLFDVRKLRAMRVMERT